MSDSGQIEAARPEPAGHRADSQRPAGGQLRARKFLFFGVLSSVVLIFDVVSKVWAETTLSAAELGGRGITLIDGVLRFHLAYNEGGAWGMFRDQPGWIRKPFFLIVSVVAILFIVSLYRRLHPSQRALRWGLPFVLGGALGNLSDRIIRHGVVDFIDYQAGWVAAMNSGIAHVFSDWSVTRHWPTFNVADIAICIGVGLMAVDMFTSGAQRTRGHRGEGALDADGSDDAGEPSDDEPLRVAGEAPPAAQDATPITAERLDEGEPPRNLAPRSAS